MDATYDLIVIGGGPSGATVAHLVAARGHRVLVLERDEFPRFKIGESLLPSDLDVFARLGLTIESGGRHLRKEGAEFFDEEADEYSEYPFADSLDGTGDHAWQVDRASFDLQVLEGAAAAGVVVHQGEGVSEVTFEGPTVAVRTPKGLYRGRYLVDASGQASVLATRHGTRRRIDEFGLGAVFAHYDDLRPAVADELAEKGNIKVLFVDQGWIWVIPLGEGRLSVGHVTRHKGVRNDWLDKVITESPLLSRLLDGARREAEPKRLGSFSFFNERTHGARWSCVGDAACFLDPVFSSGVSFGMMGASHAADDIAEALANGTEDTPGLMDAHAAHMALGYSVFATLIRSLYQRRLLPGIFFTKDQDAELRQGLTTVLAGDVWRRDNRFQERLWESKRRRFELAPSVAAV